MRTVLVIAAIIVAGLVLVLLSATTALWISVDGTFRGEHLTLGTAFQIGLAVLSCVGLAFLIRSLFRVARKGKRLP